MSNPSVTVACKTDLDRPLESSTAQADVIGVSVASCTGFPPPGLGRVTTVVSLSGVVRHTECFPYDLSLFGVVGLLRERHIQLLYCEQGFFREKDLSSGYVELSCKEKNKPNHELKVT
ncbi:hypothetical protein RRG08_018171 [Elysia crispata]|uniref:Uncharacterized protein n=1 Tax=Elysia crispata TaxID=231223 RepID=A0AAE1DX43_9GAST|nr:hypothetical protein RRG08_018171 [Elysia crispata]